MPGRIASGVHPPGPAMASRDANQKAPAAAAEPAIQTHLTQHTSRIIVKNLPKHVDEKRLREHFSAKGEVTDAKVMRTKDGTSRLFGFIGFSSSDEAQAAVNYFNRTFLDASRLDVEFAFQYGASEKPRAWSKYSEGTTAHRRLVEATGANTVALGDAKDEKRKKKKKEPKPEEVDPKLREFMALMQPRAKQAIWANDDLGIAEGATAAGAGVGAAAGAPAGVVLEDGDGSDDELYDELPGSNPETEGESSEDSEDEGGDGGIQKGVDPIVADAGLTDLEYLKRRMKKNFDLDEDQEKESEDEEESEDLLEDSDSEEDVKEEEGVEKDTNEANGGEGADASEEDMEAIFSGKSKRRIGNSGGEGVKKDGPSLPSDRFTEDPRAVIAETGRLFVRNLPYTATSDDLRTTFEAHGALEEVHLVLDKATRRSRGYALIQFENPGDAVAAFEALDRSIFMGRLLHVLPGMRAPSAVTAEEDGGADEGGDAAVDGKKATSSYKKQKEAELKASAGNKIAWNSLFMRADTVAEAVAAHYGVSKADLLDPHASDMAVRMALGETQVIAETKTELSKAGVDVSALENAAAAAGKGASAKANASGSSGNVVRSDTVLLVKNLPYSSDAEELEALFSGVGPVLRVVLPSTKTLALVEFSEAQDARKAFKALAYKRYQSVPIYLEWAPAKIFNASAAKSNEKSVAIDAKGKEEKKGKAAAAAAAKKEAVARPEDVAAGLVSGGAGDEAVESTTIYVKNLSFKTEEPSMMKHFSEAVEAAGGSVRAVKVAKRQGKDGRFMSSGFGFVECSTEDVAREVIKSMQGSSLDGHRLVLQLAQGVAGKGADAGGKTSGAGALNVASSKGATKIVVRNLAFEAARKDILGLFTSFGAVKSCRLPRKFDGSHRGFAFVEFATPQEAKTAVEAVAGTHLYGRRLAIEWAAEEGGLDELRAKTASKFRGDEAALHVGEKRDVEEEEPVEKDGGAKKRRKRSELNSV